MKKISISSLVIAGLLLNAMPAQANVKPRNLGLALFGVATLITWRLETKKSVENPEEVYTWSDIKSNVMNGNYSEAWKAFDEKFIGQKAKGSSIKLTKGDKEVKGSPSTPATGVCGKTQEALAHVAKATVETGKVLTVPALVGAIYLKVLKFGIKDDGSVTLKLDPKALSWLGDADAKKPSDADRVTKELNMLNRLLTAYLTKNNIEIPADPEDPVDVVV